MPVREFASTLVFASAIATVASAQRDTLQAPDSTPPRSVSLAAPVRIPLVASGIAGASLPVIQVMVNGRGPFRFGVETGARFVGVSRSFVDSLSLTRAAGSAELPEFHVDSITLGAATFHDLKVAVLPRAATGVDGVLGLPFFNDVLLTIDYPAQEMTLSLDSLPGPDGKTILALSRAGPFWAMPVTIGGVELNGILDTRSTTAFSVNSGIAARIPLAGEARVIGRAGGAGLPMTEIKAARLRGDVVIGAFTFPAPLLIVHDLPPGFPTDPIVGSVVLRNFSITLDQRHKRLGLHRDGPSVIPLPEPRPRPSAP